MFNADVFAGNLKKLRRQRGLTREMFAYQCGLSEESIRSYQACRQVPSTTTLINMCSGLSVSANILLEGLYQVPTERESIAYIQGTAQNLDAKYKELWTQTMQVFVNCLSYSPPKLSGADWGTRLKFLREDGGFSHKDFAAMCGITSGTLSGLESGQRLPGLDTLLLMCKILHITPDFMLLNAPGYPVPSGHWYSYLTPSQIASLKDLSELFHQNLGKED